MGGRRIALVGLVGFAVATAIAIALSGARPDSQQGMAPLVVQALGYGCALGAALVLMTNDRTGGADRRLGGAVLAAVALLVLLDVEAFTGQDGGADVGAGLLRLACLLVIVAVAGRLLFARLTSSRERP